MTRRTWLLTSIFALSLACSSGTEVAAPTATPMPTDPGLAAGGPGLAESCIEVYTLETLTDREFAFDGTVAAIEPSSELDGSSVRFDVHRWFKGGEGETVTLQGWAFSDPNTSAADGISGEVGDRMLVAGDEDFAWTCGFTQPYDAAVAADWAEVLEAG